ncbi:spermidine synthase [Desulfosporosinus acididurans]|uniref:Spermidine synthase n=1 Tax=Desulfosporosinus acididurans TaxID=476652 RepID=A0A0J1FKA9_9FIRM|nr:spermine/spermidine synthase [Desulfosporosinus acididurans]KLU63914.1 spermidine synthase [Desulfosporosinus acididurans]
MQDNIMVIERCLTQRGELQLQKRNQDYEIISNGVFLISTYNGDSERKLVTLALRFSSNPQKVLVAGLGVGYSLQEMLGETQVKEIVVLELETKIIEWNYTYFSPLMGNFLKDPRIRIIQEDLLTWLDSTEDKFDIICIDIDNGPEWTVMESNCRLYTGKGLYALSKILNPSGVVSFWSSSASENFHNRLKNYFSNVKEYQVESKRGEPDYIYLGLNYDKQ